MSNKLTRDDFEVREITVKVRLSNDPNRSVNHLEFYPGAADVSDDEGNALGSVAAGFGANVTIHDKATGSGWTLYADDFWHAVQEQIHGNVEGKEDEG